MKQLFFACLATVFMATGCCQSTDCVPVMGHENGWVKYVREFNEADEELYSNTFPNTEALEFLSENAPRFACPDTELERTYYFRWWTFRKHIRKTPDGFVITEFLPDVFWAGKHNTISCPAAHHIREGRWLKDKSIVDDYCRFWFFGGGEPRRYSFPVADAVLQFYNVCGSDKLVEDLYAPLCANYDSWCSTHRDSTGLFWQTDDRDGMEISISGLLSKDFSGYRPTCNSYAYADSRALAQFASILGKKDEADRWAGEASTIQDLVNSKLWDTEDGFYEVVPRFGKMKTSGTREEIGYIPWMYGIPDESRGGCWRALFDTLCFKAPFGPACADMSDPGFCLAYEGHECQWNGPSWPFATSQTLTAMAQTYGRFSEKFFSLEEFYETLSSFSSSHRIAEGPGAERTRCWIDENLNPFTGDWISRTVLLKAGEGLKKAAIIRERGKDYNHSTFCDLVISGLVGLNPMPDGSVELRPMIPEGMWDWFYLDGVVVRGRTYSIVFDRDGSHFSGPGGLCVYVDGRLRAHLKDYFGVRITL